MKNYFSDDRLDSWIETKLLRRHYKMRKTISYTKYTSRALVLLSDIEMPFSITRRPDLKYEVRIGALTRLGDNWEDLSHVICTMIYRVVEGAEWPSLESSNHGSKNS